MRIVCIPVVENRGLLSQVSRAFSAAPMFLLVDAETLGFLAIPNSTERQRERGCDPCEVLGDVAIDVVVVSEIDASTLGKIVQRDVPVHGGARGTVAEALASLIGGRLPALRARDAPPAGGRRN